ncbi:MAG: hypothetical protein M1816_002539 [Peltula sp. TS41687]|nr:MAG: hypothetical protein M1816_002539 [Peltula sp. TS41687]
MNESQKVYISPDVFLSTFPFEQTGSTIAEFLSASVDLIGSDSDDNALAIEDVIEFENDTPANFGDAKIFIKGKLAASRGGRALLDEADGLIEQPVSRITIGQVRTMAELVNSQHMVSGGLDDLLEEIKSGFTRLPDALRAANNNRGGDSPAPTPSASPSPSTSQGSASSNARPRINLTMFHAMTGMAKLSMEPDTLIKLMSLT